MTIQTDTPQSRFDAAVAAIKQIRARTAGRDLTMAEVSEMESQLDIAEAAKAQIVASDRARGLVGIAADGGEPQFVGGNSGGHGSGFLSFANSRGAETAASGIVAKARQEYGEKAFLIGGAVTTDTPMSQQSPIELGQTPISLLDVLPVAQHGVPIWRYLRQTVSTNNAALVAPGGTKPTSVLSLTGIDGKVEVFAHISEAVDQYLLEDNAELGRFLTGQLQFGLARAVEAQVLNGTGTGQLLGLRNTVGIQTQASLGAGLMIQTLRAGVTKLEDLGYSADLLVVNSANWQTIEATRQSGGNFDLGGPIDRAAKKAWGVPVVSTPLIPALSALALNLGAVALDTDTRGVKTDWDVATGFAVNTTRVRLEGRFGLSVFAPLGVVAITLS